jgi:hypothetical protein
MNSTLSIGTWRHWDHPSQTCLGLQGHGVQWRLWPHPPPKCMQDNLLSRFYSYAPRWKRAGTQIAGLLRHLSHKRVLRYVRAICLPAEFPADTRSPHPIWSEPVQYEAANLLSRFYSYAPRWKRAGTQIAGLLRHLSHKNPRARCNGACGRTHLQNASTGILVGEMAKKSCDLRPRPFPPWSIAVETR